MNIGHHKRAVGGDLRSGNAQYLKSTQLYSVALFSDIRTEAELAADLSGISNVERTLLVYYDMSSESDNVLIDHSANRNNLVYTGSNPPPASKIPDSEGVYINGANFYQFEKILESMPNTVETTIYLPSYFSDDERGGVIVGNYIGGKKNTYNLEIHDNGNPRVYMILEDGSILDYVFREVDVRTKDWAHLAVVRDGEANTLTCYLNGEAKQVLDIKDFEDYTPASNLFVGSDNRKYEGIIFKGKIRNLAIYSDARTEEEIAEDITSINTNDANLLCNLNFDGCTYTSVTDASNNKNNLFGAGYITTAPDLEPYAYSFAVVGDTQIVTDGHPDKLSCLYDWIVDNVDTYNIKHVFGLGDITDRNTDAEWEVATREIAKMDGKVSYSLVRGNHDKIAKFDRYLAGDSTYTAQYDGVFEEGSALNTYKFLTVGEVDYLFLSLDFGFSDEVIAWASEIIEAHPNHNVVITTHAYLYRDGTTLDENDLCPPTARGGHNNGDDMWDKFISKHENIVLVLSGHDPSANVVTTQTVGDNGNIVTQMLIDPQGLDRVEDVGPTGMISMFYFSEDGKNVQVRNYSTINKMYYGGQNQFTITLDTVDSLSGDANDDGIVDICDLVTVSNVIANIEIEYNFNNSNVWKDDVIDYLDLAEIRKLIILNLR